ncbi:MAG TPA: hypothetical protein PLV45_16870 [bacterium]|nr:hypothetical protein [bacterium]
MIRQSAGFYKFCRRVLPVIAVFFGCVTAALADPFPDAVTAFTPGDSAGFGQDQFPDIVLGPPEGAGTSAGSLDVLSLGDGGSITLEFTDNIVENGPGVDLIIFENAFYSAGNPENVFCEVAFVEVSEDGITYYRFPNDYNPEGTPVNNPANWSGFAGVHPVLSHPGNGIDPTNPDLAGGDAFDLDEVGLDRIRFVRIIDTHEGENAAVDDDGDTIYDPGYPGGDNAGFDLDAVAAVYSVELYTPTPAATPTSEPTLTPTPSPSPSPSPAATPAEFRFTLSLSREQFSPGDPFVLETGYENPGNTLTGIRLYVILDVYGDLFFRPAWTREPDAEIISIPPGISGDILLEFTWPDIRDHAEDLVIWGGLLTPEITLLGTVQRCEFRY